MKKTIVALAVAASAMTMAIPAYASQGDISVAVGAGLTQGAGVEVGYDLMDSVTLRGAYYAADFNESDTIDGIAYDLKLKMDTKGAFVDYRPFSEDSHGMRVTAGLVINDNSFSASGKPSGGNYDINGTTYTSAQVGSLQADVDFDDIVPYLGMGYDVGFTQNLSLNFEGGVIFQGSPKVKMSADGTLAADPTFQSNLESERQSAQNDMDDFKYLPVAKISLMYRF